MIGTAWPFLAEEPPVLVDWLPWSHTFGGNHNLNLALFNGGTIYIDDGRPAPPLFPRTLAALNDVPPTLYFNVPAGYALLAPALEHDPRSGAAVLLAASGSCSMRRPRYRRLWPRACGRSRARMPTMTCR